MSEGSLVIPERKKLPRSRASAHGTAIVRGTRPRRHRHRECGDFMLVSAALQTVRDVVRSAAIVRALVSRAKAEFPSAPTGYHEIGIRREASYTPATANQMLPQRAVPQPATIAVHRERSCAVLHENIGERSAVAIPLVVHHRCNPRSSEPRNAQRTAAAIPGLPRE